MKICPKCNSRYTDENLNFCLNDGEYLSVYNDDSPPTVMMDTPRITNQTNWNEYEAPRSSAPPAAPWQNQQSNINNQAFASPAFNQQPDKTLPTVSLVLGVLAILLTCCFGGFPLGLAAVITGYLGMKNTTNDPTKYGGRSMAIAGLILGVISLISSIIFVLFSLIAN